MNRSAIMLLIVATNLGGFSLANHWWFAKLAKLSSQQTFPLYDMPFNWAFYCAPTLYAFVHDYTKLISMYLECKYNLMYSVYAPVT